MNRASVIKIVALAHARVYAPLLMLYNALQETQIHKHSTCTGMYGLSGAVHLHLQSQAHARFAAVGTDVGCCAQNCKHGLTIDGCCQSTEVSRVLLVTIHALAKLSLPT